jgi:dipeptidase
MNKKTGNSVVMKIQNIIFIALFFSLQAAGSHPQKDDWEGRYPDGCTTVTVGKLATVDGSVMNSHTCDSHRTRAWFDLVPAQSHDKAEKVLLKRRSGNDSTTMPSYKFTPTGEIPQVSHTYGYINTPYPCMNDQQVAVGESTFGGRSSLRSKQGLIDCQALVRLMLERCATAREAIQLAGELTRKYGYIDGGECLTISDPQEVWHLEIVGPGKGNTGSIWVAQRVPDGHISVNANASRIRRIDLSKPDQFMASENVYSVAQDSGWWNPDDGPFEFCYAYAPQSRTSLASRRREWRVFDLCAPSLNFDAYAENYPFSIKPDTLVTLEKMVNIFQDYYEDTDYNMVKNITVTDDSGRTIISPLANPFMPYDMNKVFDINGGWGWRGERTIARWYTMYATIIQSRQWLPNPVGGVVWLAWDNVATSIYVPLYNCINDLPASYQTPGRVHGFNRGSAWWAFNRLGTLAAQRWGDMRHDVNAVWEPMQTELFENQEQIESEALLILTKDRDAVVDYLTRYSTDWGNRVVDRAWELGDYLWTKYDEKF